MYQRQFDCTVSELPILFSIVNFTNDEDKAYWPLPWHQCLHCDCLEVLWLTADLPNCDIFWTHVCVYSFSSLHLWWIQIIIWSDDCWHQCSILVRRWNWLWWLLWSVLNPTPFYSIIYNHLYINMCLLWLKRTYDLFVFENWCTHTCGWLESKLFF